MDSYAQIISYAIPAFLVLIGIELFFSKRMNRKVIRSFDTVSSLSSGITNVTKDVLGLVIVIISYGWLVDHIAIFNIQSSFWLYVAAFIGIDFAGYWSHRFEHEINLFWNRHIIHHSSEEFNLACALRQNVSAVFNVFVFLYVPLAIIGVPAEVIAVVAPLHLFAQFWYHTRLIDKMGVLEYVIVTPSHHRVHHAINSEYLDRNFGQIFILWDRWFGTFQEELADVPPVYGVKKPVQTWNPVWINFQHLGQMIKDAWYTKSLKDKLRIWIMPTGWRPEDRVIADPISITEDPYAQVKYSTPASSVFHMWVWAQLIIHLALMMYLFFNIADIGLFYSIIYGGFLVLGVMAYASLMDRDRISLYLEALKFSMGMMMIYLHSGWFGLSWGWTSVVILYLLVSLSANIYFMKHESLDKYAIA